MTRRHRCHPLFASPVLRVSDFVCWADDPHYEAEEQAAAHELAFVRRGAYEREIDGETTLLDANHVAFFNAGATYRVRHPAGGGDRSTLVELRPDVLIDLLAEADPSVAERPHRPFDRTCAAIGSVPFALQCALAEALADPPRVDALEVEETALRLVAAAARAGSGERPTARPRTAAAERRHRDLAEAAKALLARLPAGGAELAQLAGRLGCSPFHLCRVFARHTGVPMHRYRGRLRLGAALERLAGGDTDLTRLALDLGYSSHSHFTTAFKAELGHPPSRWRELPARRRASMLRDALPA